MQSKTSKLLKVLLVLFILVFGIDNYFCAFKTIPLLSPVTGYLFYR